MTQSPSPINLKDLQRTFKQYLLNADQAIFKHIVSTSSLKNDRRLAIYGNAYVSRLIESLEHDYPSYLAVLGEEQFYELCENYIKRYPSRFASLRYFGQYMAEFVRDTEPYNRDYFLHELALLEWSFIEAFDAEDAVIATEQDIMNIAPENWPQLKIVLHPSVRCFEYQWNILPIWKASANQSPVPTVAKLDKVQSCLVWRQELATQYRTMTRDETAMLLGVKQNKSFAEICEILEELVGNQDADIQQVPMLAAGIIKTWLSQGVISKFEVD